MRSHKTQTHSPLCFQNSPLRKSRHTQTFPTACTVQWENFLWREWKMHSIHAKQTTLVRLPSQSTSVWGSSIAKFRPNVSMKKRKLDAWNGPITVVWAWCQHYLYHLSYLRFVLSKHQGRHSQRNIRKSPFKLLPMTFDNAEVAVGLLDRHSGQRLQSPEHLHVLHANKPGPFDQNNWSN